VVSGWRLVAIGATTLDVPNTEEKGNGSDGLSAGYHDLGPQAAHGRAGGAVCQRWEIESAFGEWKTHQRGKDAVLRSKSADGVVQEIWVHLLVHYVLRDLMKEATAQADLDPDRMSFS
jgi:hypothetical protein